MRKTPLHYLIVFLLVINLSFVICHLPAGRQGLSFAEGVLIERIEQTRDRGYDYLDIYTTGWVNTKGLLLENKLYVDFPEASFSKKPEILSRKSTRIKDIQITRKDENTARLIVTLKKDIDYEIVNIFGRNKSVIEIGDRLENISAHQIAWETKNVKKKGDILKPIKLAPIISEKPVSLKGKTIILDPGHGGDDPGAFASSGASEKTFTLQAAQLTAKLLREAGATVILTRDEDRRPNLRDVAEFANKSGADIFISIHYNSTYSPKMSGTETYYYNPVSREFAEKMHETIMEGIKRKDRGLHRTPFYVVKNTSMPSVLLEPIYLSNSEECDLARSSSFQEKLAENIVKGVKEYFGNKSR